MMGILKQFNFKNLTGFVLSMEYLEKYGIQLSVFKVMNSMKFRVVVWKSMDFWSFVEILLGGAKLLYASIFFMQFAEKFIWILLKLIEIKY